MDDVKHSVVQHPVIHQVLRALALNREPGYHFCGNFFGTTFVEVVNGNSTLMLKPGPHCVDSDGQVNWAAFGLLADISFATSIRSRLEPSIRTATVSMTLQLTGEARSGQIKAVSTCHGFLKGVVGQQGLAQVILSGANGSGMLAFGNGAFMVLPPPKGVELHPIPWILRDPSSITALTIEDLNAVELEVFHRAEASLQASLTSDISFVEHFLGYELQMAPSGGIICTLENGPHVSNRVGHVQGGVLLGLALKAANAVLTTEWMMSCMTAYFLSPGVGDTLTAESHIIHKGKSTAVLCTQVTDANNRLVLKVTTTHARRLS